MRISLKLIVQALLWLLPCATPAQNWGITPSKPKLVVQIVVPQMHHDHLAQHWARFGDDGFKLLVNNGISCAQAHYGHQHTQSCPGLATLTTGADPAVHGIVANRWYSRTDKAKVRDAIENTKGFVGTGGVFNMSAEDHNGLDLSAFKMLEVKDGKWTLVE